MSLDRALEALHCIPPDLPRDEWVRAGMAAQAAGLGFDAFDQWSAQADNYDPRAARDTWHSFKEGKGVGAGTLFKMAGENGWRMNESKPARRPAKPAARPVEPPRKPADGMGATDVWARCEAAAAAHAYMHTKGAAGVPLDDLRVVPAGDPLRIAGESMSGALVLPVRRADGSLSTLQCITVGDTAARLKAAGRPSKLNLPGHQLEGWHVVGEPAPGAPLYVCEGPGQAWACWQATGHAAVVTFGAGRMRKVATELRERDQAAQVVLMPDVGKEAEAEAIARDLGCAVARLPEGEAPNFDANDYAQRDGLEALALLLEQAREPEPPDRLLKPVDVFGVLSDPSPPPAFVWDGYVPRGVVSLFGAHGGTGKSITAMMLAVAAATGRPLFGVPVQRCAALFVSLEDGAHVVRHRLAHICRCWSIEPRELAGLRIVDGTTSPELFAASGRDGGEATPAHAELAALAQGCGLVIVDNASDAFGGDEINRRQVRAFVRSLAQMARTVDCAVLLLAHVDKGTSRARKAEGGEGYSGSTAWHNSCRSRLFMSRAEDGALTLEHQKSNFGRLREPLTLQWPEGGLPMLANDATDVSGFADRQQGRADDDKAAGLLKLLAEFEGRGQYASPAAQARNNVSALLRSEPAFQKLKLSKDATARIVNQCQRAGWIEPLEYKSAHTRKHCQRWAVTALGCAFAGLPAPTAPTAPTSPESALGAEGADGGAPTAPTSLGGYGGCERAHVGATNRLLERDDESVSTQKTRARATV